MDAELGVLGRGFWMRSSRLYVHMLIHAYSGGV